MCQPRAQSERIPDVLQQNRVRAQTSCLRASQRKQGAKAAERWKDGGRGRRREEMSDSLVSSVGDICEEIGTGMFWHLQIRVHFNTAGEKK